MTAEVLESPERDPLPRWIVALGVVVAVVVAAAGAYVALRPEPVPPPPPPPTLPGWPAAGSRAGDQALRETAVRGWAERDASVTLEQAATLYAEDWREAGGSVVVLAMPYADHVTVAVLVVRDDEARRVSARTLDDRERVVTEHVEEAGRSAVVVVAPDAASVVVTSAAIGAPKAERIRVSARGGALVPVAAGRTATWVVVRAERGTVLADRIPGTDRDPEGTPTPLIRRETVTADGTRIQVRTDGAGTTCEVILANPATGTPAQASCETEGPPL
ncbi:MAG TPA: hypothetical protein VNQ77_12090 [Frankiaceae bacterium]|nr:hypothetical protein [Frankiaceae bacterium]